LESPDVLHTGAVSSTGIVPAGLRLVPAVSMFVWLATVGAGCAAVAAPAARPQSADALLPYVLVLGTAQDGGLPHAACTCARCEAARSDPKRRRRIASIAIVVPETGRRFLVDATPDLREQLDLLPFATGHASGGVDRRPVDGVLLTHAHAGHYLGLAFFGFEAVHTSRLPVHATARMAEFLRSNGPWSRLVAREEIELHELAPGIEFELDRDLRVTAFTVPHRDEDSDTVGFKISGPRHTIAYVPDTDTWTTWSDAARAQLSVCDTALVDGTFFSADELPGRDIAKIGHPLMPATMDVLGPEVRAGTLRVLFTHLNHSNRALDPDGSERLTIRDRGFDVASEGQRLPL
jgi:pyrroloquinoline quinone biosynthesis protein B